MRIVILLFIILSLDSNAQDEIQRISELSDEITEKELQIDALRTQIEDIKLDRYMELLVESGLPSDDHISHRAMAISFDKGSHQARWVAHIIAPEIKDGGVGRTNDFRDDPLLEGEAIESDYFLKELQADSSYVYDGFGYDRGHLAPSADFSWSREALSESYFYSNMSPQHPDFNRESWAELEATLRGYVIRNEVPLYIITMPIIKEGAALIERGAQQLPIPQEFAKLAFDPTNGRGIGFVMDNRPSDSDNADHALSIDRVEELVGMDFFQEFDDRYPNAESSFEIGDWFPESGWDGVEPIYAPSLPQDHINTTQAQRWMGAQKKVNVCGTVVSTRFSGSGNYWMNVDKKFPNTVFNVYIRKADFSNFDKIDTEYLLNEKVCFYGKVTSMYGLPNMNIVRQEQVSGLD